MIGNVDSSGRSFDGDIFYAAVYDVALTDTEVGANATPLGALDDVE